MTLLDRPQDVDPLDVPQRFVFEDVDWSFYEQVSSRLKDRRVFVTYYRGRLEVMTVSYLHERTVGLIATMVRTFAEESDTPLTGAGGTTLRRQDLDEGVQPDSSFYIKHARQMSDKKEIDLGIDPPPDLAIEVENTNRLGARKSIYRDLGVPEIWRYADGILHVLLRENGEYVEKNTSPTFPLMTLTEMSAFVEAGLRGDETTWIKSFRRRVQEIIR